MDTAAGSSMTDVTAAQWWADALERAGAPLPVIAAARETEADLTEAFYEAHPDVDWDAVAADALAADPFAQAEPELEF